MREAFIKTTLLASLKHLDTLKHLLEGRPGLGIPTEWILKVFLNEQNTEMNDDAQPHALGHPATLQSLSLLFV